MTTTVEEWDGENLAPMIPDTYPDGLAGDLEEAPANPAIEGTAGLED